MLTIVRWNFNKPLSRENQIQGIPEWFPTETYDIRAKVAASDLATLQKLSDEARRLVFRKVLTDRLKFAWHFADIDSPVYDLVIANSGLKIKEASLASLAPTTPKLITH